jgi:hypothetical protein
MGVEIAGACIQYEVLGVRLGGISAQFNHDVFIDRSSTRDD